MQHHSVVPSPGCSGYTPSGEDTAAGWTGNRTPTLNEVIRRSQCKCGDGARWIDSA